MSKAKVDLKVRAKIIREIQRLARRFGLDITRHSATKWLTTMREQARLGKRRTVIRRELAAVSESLKRLTR